MLKVQKTTLVGVLLIQPEAFEDHRGEYLETYNEEEYRRAGIDLKFVQDDYSRSSRGVLRGLHGDTETWKLVSCPYGRFYLVVVDCREGTPGFGRWESFVLSDRNHKQVLVPPQHANGHLVLSRTALFSYKQSTYYDPRKQFSYRWNDERLKVWWPAKAPILSRRDEAGQYVT